jgi:Mg-chelatase subunit ChlD
MCKFISKDAVESEGNRAPVDIICVIDRSGSMSWDNKWTNVVQTMKDLVKFLKPEDRLSIVSFASSGSKDTPLMRMD